MSGVNGTVVAPHAPAAEYVHTLARALEGPDGESITELHFRAPTIEDELAEAAPAALVPSAEALRGLDRLAQLARDEGETEVDVEGLDLNVLRSALPQRDVYAWMKALIVNVDPGALKVLRGTEVAQIGLALAMTFFMASGAGGGPTGSAASGDSSSTGDSIPASSVN